MDESSAVDFCARCGADLDPRVAAYSGDGLICKACENRELVRSAAATGSSSSLGPLGWGIVSLFCNVLMIPSILAITSGLTVLRTLKTLEADGPLEPHQRSEKTNAVIGIVLGAVHPAMGAAAVGLVVLMMGLSAIGAATARPDYRDYDDPYAYPSDPYGGGAYGSAYDDDRYDDDRYDDDRYDPLDEAPADDSYGAGTSGAGANPLADAPSGGSLDASRALAPQLAAHVARAHALGLRPYVYAHASWCGPCNAVAAHRSDPRMRGAFEGTYIIEADIDDVDLSEVGLRVRGIPAWYGVDERARPNGRVITGGAWGENVPENMAGPLDGFFHG